MKCPKCGKPRVNEPECPHCGIVYQKYIKAQQQRPPAATAVKAPAAAPIASGLMTYLLCAVAVCILGGLVYLFISQKPAPPSMPPSAEVVAAGDKETQALETITAQTQQTSPARNPIEKARNATVFVKTNFGSGSGFFIDKDCHIITNRHVVQVSADNMAEFEFESKQLDLQIAQFERMIQTQINLYRYQGVDIDPDNPPPQLALMIQTLYKARARREVLGQIMEGARSQGSQVEVTLVDGSTYDAEILQISENHDLALLQIMDNECPFIQPDSVQKLQFGQKLYTIGNPEGLMHSVTGGVLSGQRTLEEETFIQTDAPINPGNSGGPLINEAGFVVGINTARYADAEGIGFAIPIETALDAFPDYLSIKL